MVWPVKIKASVLIVALDHPDFPAGTVETGLIGCGVEAMVAPPKSPRGPMRCARWLATSRSPLSGSTREHATIAALVDGEPTELALDGPGDEPAADEALIAGRAESGGLRRGARRAPAITTPIMATSARPCRASSSRSL